MKRWIVILTLSVFGFTPICGALAMTPSITMQDESCAMIGSLPEIDQHASETVHPAIPTLSCCERDQTAQNSTEALSTFQVQPPVIHECVFTCLGKHLYSRATEFHEKVDHPPDDFERYSLAKRE